MKIVKVKINDKTAKISFDNGNVLQISLETYLNHHLLVGEEISQEEIDEVSCANKIDLIKLDLLKKLSRKRLSVKESKEYLQENGLTNEQITKIIASYQDNGLINDIELGQTLIDYCLVVKKGKNYLKRKFSERGIQGNYEEIIDSYLDENRYRENIEYLIDKYKKLGKNKSNSVLSRYIIDKLIENGYEKEEFISLVGNFKNDEIEIVNKEIKRFFVNREVNEENIAKITKKLLSKGFNYGIIKQAIRECENHETY